MFLNFFNVIVSLGTGSVCVSGFWMTVVGGKAGQRVLDIITDGIEREKTTIPNSGVYSFFILI